MTTNTTTSTSREKHGSFINRLSTGTGAFNILRPKKVYYWVGIILVIASLALIVVRGFNLGIDFAGGTTFTFSPPQSQQVSNEQVSEVVSQAAGLSNVPVQTIGTGASANFQITTSLDSELDKDKIAATVAALTEAFNPASPVSESAVSGTWGAEVSEQAIISVIVFLIAVALFIWIRYERKASIAAVVSTVQVLIITAGIYSLVGFEMTPATVIGLLTILGFSLYDTVVVFDKVQENTRGLTSLTRRTYSEAAVLAVNQTMMRSINTSLIALLPVGGLLVAGVALLGSGTLKDLALVQLVGMIVGAYSSLFVAVPMAVDLREREPALRAHTKRVLDKRAAEGLLVDGVGDPIGRTTPKEVTRKGKSGKKKSLVKPPPVTQAAPLVPDMKPGEAPRPGVRPTGNRSRRPTGKAARASGKRPS